jgi:hypothetical protein
MSFWKINILLLFRPFALEVLEFPNGFWENTEWVSKEILTCACIRIKIKLSVYGDDGVSTDEMKN